MLVSDNIEQHLGCMYYATADSALFWCYSLSDGDDIAGINENRSALLYLAEGSLQVYLRGLKAGVIQSPKLVFLPKNIDFKGSPLSDCYLIACFFEGKIPLCNKYDLINLRRNVSQNDIQKIPPPVLLDKYLFVRRLCAFIQDWHITLIEG